MSLPRSFVAPMMNSVSVLNWSFLPHSKLSGKISLKKCGFNSMSNWWGLSWNEVAHIGDRKMKPSGLIIFTFTT